MMPPLTPATPAPTTATLAFVMVLTAAISRLQGDGLGCGSTMTLSAEAKAPTALADEAAAFRVNHGLAEEIFLMKPDLILAGTFTSRATVNLLKRLGFRVEEFAPERSLSDIRASLRRMGALLGRTSCSSNGATAGSSAGMSWLKRDCTTAGRFRPRNCSELLIHWNLMTSRGWCCSSWSSRRMCGYRS